MPIETEPYYFNFQICTSQQFEKLFKLHYQWLCYQANRITNEWQLSEDLVQDFFTKCWNNKKTIGEILNFRGYALSAVRNAAINYKMKLIIEQKFVAENDTNLNEIENPLENEDKEELIFKLIQAINNLPMKRKKIFLSFYFDEMKSQEIAQLENLSVETVKTQIKLAYRMLRKVLLLKIFF